MSLHKLGFLFCIVGFVIYACLGVYFLTLVPQQLSRAAPPVATPLNERFDALVVFTGGTKRIDTVRDMVNKGFSGRVLISGVHPSVKRAWVLRNLSPENRPHVELDYRAQTTRDNVRMTLDWVKKNGIKRLGLITSHYHVPRSLKMFEQAGGDITVEALPVFPDKMPATYMLQEFHKYIGAWLRII